MPYFQADPNADDYHRKLEEIRQFADENYKRLSEMVGQAATVFTPDDEIRAHAFGVTLYETAIPTGQDVARRTE